MGLELVEDALQLPAYRVKRGQFKGRRLARIQQGGREPLGLVLRILFLGISAAAHGHSSGPASVDGRGKKSTSTSCMAAPFRPAVGTQRARATTGLGRHPETLQMRAWRTVQPRYGE